MYSDISNDAKTALKAKDVTTTARITLTSDNTVIDGDNLTSITIIDQCYENGVIVGTAMCKEVEIELINNNYDLADKEFLLEVGVLLPNATYEYIPFGNFIVKDYQKIVSSNHYKLVAYDYMDKFNQTFVDENDYSSPITLQDFYEYVADQYDVEIETQSNLPNADFSIATKPYFEGMSGRVVLSRIAEMMGCFAKINRENKLEMRLKNVTSEQFSRDEMNTSLERDDLFGPVNVVALRLSQIEGENVTKRDEESITQYGETTLQISDNPFVYSEALRLLAIDDIYDQVDGFSYYPTTFNGKLIYLDCGDEVEVQDMATNSYYKTIILKQTLIIPSTRSSKFENKALTDTGLQYQYTSEQVRTNKRTEYLVDKQNQQITALVETTETIDTTLNNMLDAIGSKEGKIIYINDSSNQPIISAKFNGETYQKVVANSRNIFNKNAEINDTINAAAKSVLDTGVKIYASNGRSYNANVYVVMKLGNRTDLLGKTIRIKATATPSANNLIPTIGIAPFSSDYSSSVSPQKVSLSAGETGTIELTYTVTSEIEYYTDIGIILYVTNGSTTSTNDYVDYTNLMVTVDDADMTYEAYGSMPSIDMPSEIINLKGKNIFDAGYYETATYSTDTYKYTETNINNSSKLYTKARLKEERNAISGLYVALSDNTNPTATGSISSNFISNGVITNGNNTFDGSTLYFSYYPTTVSVAEIFDTYDFWVSIDDIDYVPYNSIAVKVINQNLFDDTTQNNLWIAVDGTLSAITDANTLKYPCKSGEAYTLKATWASSTDAMIALAFYDKEGELLLRSVANDEASLKVTATAPTDAVYVYAAHYSTIPTTIQLEKKTDTDYVEHLEQIAFFPLEELKLYEGSYLANDGIHYTRKQVTESGTTITLLDAKTDGAYVCDKKLPGNLSGKNLVFDTSVTDALIEYELATEVVIPYTSEQQTAWDNIMNLTTYKNITNIYSDAYAEIEYVKDNGLDVYETRYDASRKYTETTRKFAEQQITNDSIVSRVSAEEERTNSITGEVESTKSQVNILEQRIDGLTNTVVEKGGNNLFYYDLDFWKGQEVTTTVRRTIQVGDDLSGKKIYLSFPTESPVAVLDNNTGNIIVGENGEIYHYKREAYYEEYVSVTYGVNEDIIYEMASSSYVGGETEYTMPNNFGVVTQINAESGVYQYIQIDVDVTERVLNMQEVNGGEFGTNTVSGRGYIVNDGSSSQDTNDNNISIPNNVYTVSFLYKKIGAALTNASVKINGEEYELTATEWTKFQQSLVVTTNHLEVEFIADTDNTLYVADLLGNLGEVADIWTQNPNETRTDTVKIGKGIEVISSVQDTKLKADADGVRIVEVSNENNVVAEFTKDGTRIKKLIAENQAQIAGILIQQIGDQTWISSLL